jgi:CDP-paratose 2-epimerase
MGGGPANTISLLELLEMIEQMNGGEPLVDFSEWRPGDQRYYVSDTTKFRDATGWAPRHSAEQGVRELHRWLVENDIAPQASARPVQAEVL